MKNLVVSAAFAISLFAPVAAAAGDDATDRSQAIALCRAEVRAQAGEGANVRFDQVRVRPRAIRVEFDLWRGNQLQNVRCEVSRGDELVIASITPALQTASLAQ